MIDIQKVKEEFNKYVQNFDVADDKIKLKKEHIERVAILSKMIAQDLNLNDEQILLAEVIGYFHDIGRFKQVEEYDTFNDKVSINHAEYSIKVLFEDKLIEKFDIEEKYFDIIKKAVLNHNKDNIEEGLTDKEMLFAKIIRDADKLDIYYVICNYELESVFWSDKFDVEKINDNQILTFYAFVFDFNFDISKRYLKGKGYLDYFAKRLETGFSSDAVKIRLKEVLQIANEYLQKY